MFESCRAHFGVRCSDGEVGVVGNIGAQVAERDSRATLVIRPTTFSPWRISSPGSAASISRTRSVRFTLPAVVQPRDRLLPRVAAFRERDVRLVQAGFRRQDRVVELLAPRRDASLDPHPLELLAGKRRLEPRVEHLCPGLAELDARDLSVLTEHDDRGVFLALDLDLGRELRAEQGRAHGFAETRFGQEEEVLGPSPDTTSGAMRRDFGVSSSAWQGAAVTSFDTIRWRKSSASGPATPT